MTDPGQQSFPCPCCGYFVFDEPPGNYEICPICFWEDDPVQLRLPDYAGGANRVSLIEAQRNFSAIGASETRVKQHVRAPTSNDRRDLQWRPFNSTLDRLESAEFADPASPYYWRKS